MSLILAPCQSHTASVEQRLARHQTRQDVYLASGPKVITQYRTKYHEAPNAKTTTETLDLRCRGCDF